MRGLLLGWLLAMAPAAAQISVAAASDLAPLEAGIRSAFQRQSGNTVRFSLGSSGMLARQIRHGAPFDVFLSANEAFTKELVDAGALLPDTVAVYAIGRLGVWSKDPKLRDIQALTSPGVRHVAIANPKHAPYGVAAQEYLEKLGVLRAMQPKLVFAENVRQAFEFANSGNAEAAITSWTVVHNKGGVLLPQNHAPVRQSAGVVKSSPRQSDARLFLRFLLSPEGRKILQAGGLSLP